MISHLIAVFVGAAFIGAPVGIAVMAWLVARRIKRLEEEVERLRWVLRYSRESADMAWQMYEAVRDGHRVTYQVIGSFPSSPPKTRPDTLPLEFDDTDGLSRML